MAKRRRRRAWFGRLLVEATLMAGFTVLALWWLGQGSPGHGRLVHVQVAEGASFAQVTDSLARHGIVHAPLLFQAFAHLTGASARVRPGTYGFHRGAGWNYVLAELREGRVLVARLVIPEGWTLPRIATRMARLTPLVSEDSVLSLLRSPETVRRFGVPGPTMEGYLYPATYSWPVDTPLDSMLWMMVRRYQRVWTPARRARADSLGMTEREAVTLASIVQAEAKRAADMPIIAGVYRNRLRIGMALQADPTVQYALRQRKDRLLYADIQSVADDPYNTYTHKGLPPGPISCPDEQALDAALRPADVDYLYFVARPDGTNIFSRTLTQHNRAKAQVRALLAAESASAAAAGAAPPTTTPAAGTAPAGPTASSTPAAPATARRAPARTSGQRRTTPRHRRR